MIRELFELGQASGKHWLERHHAALGRHSTVDITRDYLDDTQLHHGKGPIAERPRGWRPWLAQLLRRARGARH